MKRFISKRLYKFYLNEGDLWPWCLARMNECQHIYYWHKYRSRVWYVNPVQVGC